jgi:creatinine amidohydrolase
MNDEVLYSRLTPSAFAARLQRAPIAYLPLGTLEWHGEHLPLGSDGLQSQGFFAAVARRAGGIVLPMLFLGPDRAMEVNGKAYYGMDYWRYPDVPPRQLEGSAYRIPENLFVALLEAILEQLERAGFRIVCAHGHGPSTATFRDRIAEWESRFRLRLFICWREDESDGLGIQTDHAAANETSLMMALHPDLVHMENLPADPDEWPEAVGGRDPRVHANPDAGRKAINLQADRMAELLRAALGELDQRPA